MGVQWTPDLSVGVELIDNQHKELFRRVNDLLEASSQGRGKEEIGRLIQFLADYVVTHFAAEERTMARYGYSGLSAHRAEHNKFVRDFTDLAQSYQVGGVSSSLVITLQSKVVGWLINHIGKSDKVLGAFIQQQAEGRPGQRK